MLIISQNVEIWVEQSPFGILTLCTTFIAFLTVFIRKDVKGQLVLENLLLVVVEEEVLVQ